ncbi:MAG: hypothetical protein ACFFD4_32205 [Candidatus Odinarchaeota archaeon]
MTNNGSPIIPEKKDESGNKGVSALLEDMIEKVAKRVLKLK